MWRFWFYGDVLPNTYYAKSGLGPLALVRGAKYVFEFFKAHGGPVLPALAVAPLFWGARSRDVSLLAGTVRRLPSVRRSGGRRQFFRVSIHCANPATALSDGRRRGGADARRAEAARRAWTATRALPLVALLLLSAVFAAAPIAYAYVPVQRNVAVDAPLTDANQLVTMGEWLRGIAPPDSTIAVGEAGAVPYATQWRTLDAFGLSDRAIARAPRESTALGLREICTLHHQSNPDVASALRRVLRLARIRYGAGTERRLFMEALLAAGYVPTALRQRPRICRARGPM